jgi:hypothetical protein
LDWQGGWASTLADLDGDGDPDLAVLVSPSAQDSMSGSDMVVLGSDGQGNFSDTGQRLRARESSSVALGDVDGDGDLDALVAGGRQARLWWNDGEGHFSPAKQSCPCNARQDITVADVNGDGWEAIFVGEYDNMAWVWVNEGEGRFRWVEGNPD